MLSIAKSEEWKPLENIVPLVAEEKVDTPQENGDYLGISENPSGSNQRANKNAKLTTGVQQPHWFSSFRHNFHRFRRRTRKRSGSQRIKSKKLSRSDSTSSRF